MLTVLLDFDGTFADSGPFIFASARHTLEHFGLPEPADMRPFVGPPLEYGMHEVLGIPEHLVREAIDVYRDYQYAHLADVAPYNGMVEVVDEMRERGWTVAIATSRLEVLTTEILDLQGLTSRFHAIGGGTPETSAKAASITRALDKLVAAGRLSASGDRTAAGLDTTAPIMVGDRIHDIEGARAHGLRVVYAAWGYGTPQEGAHADAVADTPADLIRVLEELAAR